jgi:folylpolyglutamate synthase
MPEVVAAVNVVNDGEGGKDEEEELELRYSRCLSELAKTISGKNRNSPGSVTWEDQFKLLHAYVDELDLRSFIENSNAIHVAGTKGKGSTCAFAESILLENGVENVGLFTSPHLVDVRERFRINGNPVGKREFIEAFWWTKNTIENELKMELPAYFRFLFLLGLKIFKDAGTKCLILEVGLGGRLDATNCVREPAVVAVTSLGLDHVEVLGNTIEKIAWEKAGIFKKGANGDTIRAFTSPQVPEAMASLERKREEVGCELVVARQIDLEGDEDENDEEGGGGRRKVELGLSGPHQRINASLAVELVKEWAAKTKHRGILAELEKEREKRPKSKLLLPDSFRRGLEKTRWPGREQIVRDEHSKNLTFYLDGAHTEESMRTCAEWFSAHVNAKRKKDAQHDMCYNEGKRSSSGMSHNVFLFNCMEERSPKVLMSASVDVLKSRNVHIDTAMFCPPDSSALGLVKVEDDKKNLEWQEACATTWREIEKVKGFNSGNSGDSSSGKNSSTQMDVRASVAAAISALRRKADLVAPKRVDVLVAGSLYLVGDILRQLKKLGVK